MKKYSSAYILLMITGLLCTANAFVMWNYKAPAACAVMCVFAFIFLWAPQMLPDNEKYKQTKGE